MAAMWGAQTQRAVENFPISGRRMPTGLIHVLGRIKAAAARVSRDRSDLPGFDSEMADAIEAAALEVVEGRWDDQFPVDVYQTGSGTSTNMNANEVIARRAGELCGRPVHPNDHVNASQSSNDVIPTSIRVATALQLRDDVAGAIDDLCAAIDERAHVFAENVKAGRTHLMDAAPMFVGDEMSAWASQLRSSAEPVRASIDSLSVVPLGGSAVGTGLNVPDGWPEAVLAIIGADVGLDLTCTANRFALMAGGEGYAEASSALRGVAVALTKVANDLRWLSSGPFCGLAELRLPDLQPGSSIMPGKVNPVIPEAVLQAAARVQGNDVVVGTAAAGGSFQLNTYLPLIASTLDESARLVTNSARSLAQRCVRGISLDAERCRRYAEMSPALVTGLALSIGYEAAAEAVQEAIRDGRGLREVLEDRGLDAAMLDVALDPVRLAEGTACIDASSGT